MAAAIALEHDERGAERMRLLDARERAATAVAGTLVAADGLLETVVW